MNEYHAALLIGAIVAAALSWREPRGVAWIVAGAASFIATAGYEAAGYAYHPIITGFVDAGVWVLVYLFAAFRWEMWLYRIFQTSVLISLLRATGWIDSHTAYVVALEACNWVAIVVVGGTAAWGWIDARVGAHRAAPGRLRRAVASLYSPRSSPPFTKVE